MNPYYKDGTVTIYHGDCNELLSGLPSWDTLVLDPPFDKWAEAPFIEASRTVAFTNWQNRDDLTGIYGRPRFELVWHFDDGRWVTHHGPRLTHEQILVYGDTQEAYVGEPHMASPQKKGRGAIGRDKLDHRVYVPRKHKQLDSVLHFPRNVSGNMGVWGKPLPLMMILLIWIGGGVILDPFMGGGTTLRAAKNLGRKAVGVEIDERCCEIAAKRMSQEALNIMDDKDNTVIEVKEIG